MAGSSKRGGWESKYSESGSKLRRSGSSKMKDENRRLKQLVADLSLDCGLDREVLKAVIRKIL